MLHEAVLLRGTEARKFAGENSWVFLSRFCFDGSLLPSGELAIGLNVRKTPSRTGEVAYIAATNSTIYLTGGTTNVDGVVWWQVVDGNWAQGQFLKFG